MKEDLDIIKEDIAIAGGYIHEANTLIKENRLSLKKGFKLVCEKLDNINNKSIIKKIFNKK